MATLAMGAASPVATQSAPPDPMRPPSFVHVAPADSLAAPTGASVLQTIILRRKGKPLAVINGETVELGGRIGDARLVKLSDNEAVLQGPRGRESLRLTPAAGKNLAAVVPSRSRLEGGR